MIREKSKTPIQRYLDLPLRKKTFSKYRSAYGHFREDRYGYIHYFYSKAIRYDQNIDYNPICELSIGPTKQTFRTSKTKCEQCEYLLNRDFLASLK
jgi:hypothetical protein